MAGGVPIGGASFNPCLTGTHHGAAAVGLRRGGQPAHHVPGRGPPAGRPRRSAGGTGEQLMEPHDADTPGSGLLGWSSSSGRGGPAQQPGQPRLTWTEVLDQQHRTDGQILDAHRRPHPAARLPSHGSPTRTVLWRKCQRRSAACCCSSTPRSRCMMTATSVTSCRVSSGSLGMQPAQACGGVRRCIRTAEPGAVQVRFDAAAGTDGPCGAGTQGLSAPDVLQSKPSCGDGWTGRRTRPPVPLRCPRRGHGHRPRRVQSASRRLCHPATPPSDPSCLT